MFRIWLKNAPGTYALVDDQDAHLASYVPRGWNLHSEGYVFGYARGQLLYLHRLIMSPDKTEEVDHRDGNGLNNQRYNLRVCTLKRNRQNQRKQKRHTISRFKGVCVTTHGSWRSYICVDSKQISLGTYATEERAAYAYNCAAIKYFGEFAALNPVGRCRLIRIASPFRRSTLRQVS